jgi:hypothetical protein
MLQCIDAVEQNIERDNREKSSECLYAYAHTRVIIKDMRVNKIYGTIDDNNKVVILGVLRSNAQCGYANGEFIHPTYRCIFANLADGKTMKLIKKWNDHLVELSE